MIYLTSGLRENLQMLFCLQATSQVMFFSGNFSGMAGIAPPYDRNVKNDFFSLLKIKKCHVLRELLLCFV
jgi:hypothetical protein